MVHSHVCPRVLAHGLQHVSHVPCEEEVTLMSCGVAEDGFLSLHRGGRVRFYTADGFLREPPACSTVPYQGVAFTQISGRLVGWGPGKTLTLLDMELRPLAQGHEALDIRVCQMLEGSRELVTAGAGNVCVWSVCHLVCRVRVMDGFEGKCVFTHLALVPAAAQKASRALAVCGRSVTVVDLGEGRVLEHKTNLHQREITALVYCPLQDVVVTASKDASLRVWGSDWTMLTALVGHTAMVTSLLWCPLSSLLLSSSLDSTLRYWNLQTGDWVKTLTLPTASAPPLSVGGPSSTSTFFCFSKTGVDFWTFNSLYKLHCKLGRDTALSTVQQILATPSGPHYPARLMCVHGNSDVTLIAAGTGAVLTTFRAGEIVRCADYCLYKEVLMVLTDEGAVIKANTLTNPMTWLDTWTSRESGRGEACCMTVYSHIADEETALEEWKELQQERGEKARARKQLEQGKNSQDGTLRLWDEENRLIRTLELNAEPECVQFSGRGGELLLGIRGDVYRIHLTHLLPPEFQTQDLECLLERDRDLCSLQSGDTHRRRKQKSTPQSRREAFNRYIQLLYKPPTQISISDEDPLDLHADLFPRKPPELRPLTPPTLREGFFPNWSLAKKPDSTHTQEGVLSRPATASLGFVPNSVLVGQIWPEEVLEKAVPSTPWTLRDGYTHNTEEEEEEERKADVVQYLDEDEDDEFNVNSVIHLIETSPGPESPTPPPPVTSPPENPSAEKPRYTLKPLKPLPPIKTPPPPTPPQAIPAPPPPTHMPKPTLPAFLNQFLQEEWFHSMYPEPGALGVDDAQQWLLPELESWEREVPKHTSTLGHLRELAHNWLNSWKAKYKIYKSAGKKSALFSLVTSPSEVLRYFCWVQKEAQVKPPAGAEGRKDTVLLDTHTYRWKAVHRLGETHSMTRVRESQGLWLPPLTSRPRLSGFTRLLSLPLPRVTASSFPFSLKACSLKEAPLQRYFLLERSYVHFYR
ncbi:hypothetical protein KOW79_006830 [Hemibagrus wyckioides]|uniref:WD repeat-containing protein 97 n=1 Tax=Hemibagrus wyckioides TaxID=337641 RepID=A0A9D3NX44_9TELE|nr:hypothetical protein KOW79_006830 [Hemibagrus wyckioides]